MNRIFLILFLPLLLLTGCDERFTTWKEYNEVWLENQKAKLGSDPEVIEVMMLESGVLVEVYHNGYGAIPKPSVDPVTESSSAVRVRYKGWLVDGTLFDENDDATFALSGVVKGWQDALSQMRQGSHWRIYIPSHRGYGADGIKDWQDNFNVPPYSVMIFDIDLIDVRNY